MRTWALTVVSCWLSAVAVRADDDVFLKQVAPILERRCVTCHQGASPKGGLSIVDAAGFRRGGENGPIVVPGKPADSALMGQITGDKPAMPQNAAPLSTAEVAILRSWIEQGAIFPDGVALKDRKFDGEKWWAFEPLVPSNVPKIDSPWIRSPIDAFILASLRKQGLSPSPEADRRTLIRRLSFDLLGLPPTPEQTDAFVADADPAAYEKLVDQLLASPHYGERWARHWLDVVHYGETHGFDKDKIRPNAWPYRDYVIRSINTDKPYGRFIDEQLAGDFFLKGEPEGTIATGFVVAGPWDFVGQVELAEGTLNKDITRSLDRDDMTANAMSTFCSLTVHCARCHDHPFDPIQQAEYYRLQAVFAGVERTDVDVEPKAAQELRRQLADRKEKLLRDSMLLADRMEASRPAAVRELDAAITERRLMLKSTLGQEGSDVDASPTNGYHGNIAAVAKTTQWVQLDLGKPTPIDEVRLIPARPTDFPDTKGFGFPLQFKVTIADDAAMKSATVIADETAGDYLNPGDTAVAYSAGGRTARFIRVTATKLWRRGGEDFVFALAEMEVESGGRNLARYATVTAQDSIEAGRWGAKNLIDGFDSRRRIPVRALTPLEMKKRRRIQLEIERLESERQAALAASIDAKLRDEKLRLEQELAETTRRLAKLPAPKKVYAAKSIAPRPIHRLHRGETTAPKELVAPGSVGCIAGYSGELAISPSHAEPERRAALARWISNPKNPLTWRSIVNRVWHYHIGRGIVETPNDFGRLGAAPTHPELLDWLAVDFLEHDQSLKHLHRRIVLSAAYRQSSADDANKAKIDGANRYLWRMNRRRLEAEALRDAVLAASGKLDRTMGGPGFFAFAFEDDHSPRYLYDKHNVDDPKSLRRSIYRFVVRSAPDPFMECLDCADPSLAVPARDETLTALQALSLLNNPFMIRQAERLAERATAASGDLDGRLNAAFRWTLARSPTKSELRRLREYANKHGLANACRLMFNSNEFVFVD